MKIQYVGLQAPHRERLYGTKTLFSGPGDVKDFDDQIARKLVTNHPDQYAYAGDDTQPEPASNDREILVNGEYKALSKCTKQELEDFAKANFGVDLDKRAKVADLAAEVAGLIAAAELEE